MTPEVLNFTASDYDYENLEAVEYFASEMEKAEDALLEKAKETPFYLTEEIARIDSLRKGAIDFIEKRSLVIDDSLRVSGDHDPDGDYDLFVHYLLDAEKALAEEVPETILGDAAETLKKLRYSDTLNMAYAALNDWCHFVKASEEDELRDLEEAEAWRKEYEAKKKQSEGNIIQFTPAPSTDSN